MLCYDWFLLALPMVSEFRFSSGNSELEKQCQISGLCFLMPASKSILWYSSAHLPSCKTTSTAFVHPKIELKALTDYRLENNFYFSTSF